ncbi:hypothetical protein VTJ49DRAFT_4802 [Mycothermus thermophilus]|uniref:RanBD1 domain-containing protein n=1 Tax=Humicola insolens TaxID=85995 RepID=A0ABR3V4K0_HUMIN
MDAPTKKRGGLFAFTGLFRSSSTPAEDRDAQADSSARGASNAITSAQRQINTVAAPNSPVKRATTAQLASRKIIDRPQGPSSKLSQSFSVNDIPHRPSSALSGPPRRMPGDNPYKTQAPPALPAPTTSRAPYNNIPKSTSFSGAPSTSRNIFRSSTLYQRHGTSNFAPRVPDPLNQSFPPATPGRPTRGTTPDVNGRILANTGPSELFNMKIASPPRHITGEMMAREVPNDPNRTGSIYADEFLSHLCPPEFDDLQRRQFFCILDLRRLKYAADEVFTKKDWKINILNFAKEYEKSRSLIMLRYGLYEFKTVRASEAVKKEWKQKHGIPDSEDDEAGAVAYKPNGTVKRKAEEELEPTAKVLASPAKRARAPESPARNKRKADSDLDENQPAKLQKPGPAPSATKSVFESIANSTQTFKPSKPTKSLFDTAPKATTTGNLFGHLSDGSKSSGNAEADEVSETSSNADEDESEGQEAGEGDEESASGSASASQLANGTSSASSDAGGSSQGRSLFDRITRDADGQPVRKVPPGTDLFAASAMSRSVSPAKEQQPAAAPANNTWNAGAPIKFAPTSAPLFGAKPATTSTIDFGAAGPKAEAKPATEAPKEAPAQGLFGAQPKKTEEAAGSTTTTNGAKPNLFSSAKPAEAPSATSSIFGTSTTPATTSNLFASATPSFGQPKESEAKDSSSTPAPAPSLFGAKPTTTSTTTPATEAPKTNLFQFGQSKTDATPASQPQLGGLFGKPQSTENKTDKPATSLFSTDTPKTNLFGAAATSSASGSEEPAAKKVTFGSDTKPAGSLFGSAASTPVPETSAPKPLFGATTTPAASGAETKPLFGTTTTPAPTETKGLFGVSTTPATTGTETKGLFGATTAAPTETKNLFGASTTPAASGTETKSLFGTTPGAPTESKPLFGATTTESKPLFGSTTDSKPLFGATTTESKPLFGAATTESKPLFGATTTEPKPLFGATTTESKPLFGATTTTESKPLFGAAPAADNKPAGLFADPPAAAAPPSSSIFNFGASTPTPTSQPAAGGSIFGVGGSASFTFSAGGSDGAIKNPFASDGGTISAPSSFHFGSETPASTTPFTFGAGAGPTISFGSTTDTSTQQPATGSIFNFGASSQTSTPPVFGQNPPTAAPIFGSSLAPGGGTSTGTNSPFTFGGASSLATTPAASTPEPSAANAAATAAENGQGTDADGDDAPQEQISLTDGGPGEEEEHAVFEVRAKAVKLVTGPSGGNGDSEDDSGSKSADKPAKSKSPWQVQGVGPLRLLKHKTTGAVRMLLRAEPRGNVALNKVVLPDFTYKADAKYVKVPAATDDGKGLETWMLQVKTAESAKELAEKLEEHKTANKKK